MVFIQKNNLPEIEDGTYIINLDELKSIETHCVSFYVISNNIIYFDDFGVEHIPKNL